MRPESCPNCTHYQRKVKKCKVQVGIRHSWECCGKYVKKETINNGK
jgi:hypothetical protein